MKLTPADLTRIAAAMLDELAASPTANGMVQRKLDPYTLLVFNRDGALRLHVGLTGRWPTLEETLPFAQAFGVPSEDQEPRAETYRLPSRLGGPRLLLQTMRYAWHQDLIANRHVRPAAGRQLTFFGALEA